MSATTRTGRHEPLTLAELDAYYSGLLVRCPRCGSAPGVDCHQPSGKSRWFCHEARYARKEAYITAFRAGYEAAIADAGDALRLLADSLSVTKDQEVENATRSV